MVGERADFGAGAIIAYANYLCAAVGSGSEQALER